VGGAPGGVGSRVFNVAVNGTPVLSNFDIYAAAGGANIALERDLNVTSSTTGTVTVAYTTITDNAKNSGIELLANAPTLNATPESAPPHTTLTVAGSGFTPNAVVTFYWDAAGGYQLGTATADASGHVSASVTTPAGATAGAHAIVAVDSASKSARAGAAVVAGAFGVSAPASVAFPAVALTGAAQATTVALAPLTVTDLRGSGVGWTLSLQAPDFASGAGRTLPFGGLQVAAVHRRRGPHGGRARRPRRRGYDPWGHPVEPPDAAHGAERAGVGSIRNQRGAHAHRARTRLHRQLQRHARAQCAMTGLKGLSHR